MRAGPSNARLLLILAAVGGGVLLFCFDPTRYPYPHCLFHEWTGLYCPGCGSTRALYQLLHGHPLAALRMNALAVASIPFLTWAGLREKPLSELHPMWVWGIFVLVVSFAVLRNIPLPPFLYLAPPG